MRGLLAGCLALAALALAPAANAQYLDPNPPWPQLLPAAPTSDRHQPGPVPGCEQASLECVERVIARLREVRDRYGCDHRGVFATTYLLVTEQIHAVVRDKPTFYEDNDWLIYQDALFADYYFRALDARERGEPVPEAWRIAFDTAERGDANAAQDMLLGINAHVQRDMPFVVAEVGLRKADGSSRKRDHDIGNRILTDSYEPIVKEIAERFDPIVSLTNSSAHPIDDVAGLEVVATWREMVWRNAERLVEAKTPQERAQIAEQIEQNAAAWARAIADFPQQPGYRAQRDRYCADAAARRASENPAGGGQPAAQLSVSRGCGRRKARAVVSGSGIRRVRFRLNGKRLGGERRGQRWRARISRRRLERGPDNLVARVVYDDGRTEKLRAKIRRCRS